MRRRDFLHLAASLPLVLWAPRLWARAPSPDWNRVLVLLELAGGNDGLNTVVPYADPLYYELRPRLAVARDQVLPLSPALGFNPALQALLPAWQARELAIVLGVGYDNPNRSHFRSIEIWDTASDAEEVLTDGWLARSFAANPVPAEFAAHGIVFGRDAGPLAGAHGRNLVVQEAEQFLRQAAELRPAHTASGNPALDHLLNVQNETRRGAEVLRARLMQAPRPASAFPGTRLGRQLEVAAILIAARTPVAVIKVSHGSFDTHANQRTQHDRLLRELAEALAALRAALIASGDWQRTLVMTYSEFGRRARENGSLGTDHGTAAPHFLLGGRVKGGLYGQQPALAALADGDLRHHLDYRSLYTTVAQRWWGLPRDAIAARAYPPLDCLA